METNKTGIAVTQPLTGAAPRGEGQGDDYDSKLLSEISAALQNAAPPATDTDPAESTPTISLGQPIRAAEDLRPKHTPAADQRLDSQPPPPDDVSLEQTIAHDTEELSSYMASFLHRVSGASAGATPEAASTSESPGDEQQPLRAYLGPKPPPERYSDLIAMRSLANATTLDRISCYNRQQCVGIRRWLALSSAGCIASFGLAWQTTESLSYTYIGALVSLGVAVVAGIRFSVSLSRLESGPREKE